MGLSKQTGRTKEQLKEMREEFDPEEAGMSFNERYCLAKIPNQPPEYDGPVRYCIRRHTLPLGDNWLCEYHGGAGQVNEDNLTEFPNMKHGMRATQEGLAKNFDDKDQALYNWIMDEWPEAYDVNLDEDPSARYDMHRLAVEVVRAERGRGYLVSEGEVQEEEVRGDDGRVVIGDDGEVVTRKSQHYLHDMLYRQDKKITDLEKELGISRKERLRQDTSDSAVDAIKSFVELGSEFIDRDDKDYDPNSEPWSGDDE